MPEKDIRKEAVRILELAEERNLTLKLLGGLAIHLQCPSVANPPFKREYKDIDVVGYSRDSKAIQNLFYDAGYVADRRFNTLHGHERLFFWDEENSRQVDVFLDRMKLCHTIDFRERLEQHRYTLPLSDLLLTKLQVVEINQKDIMDALAIFQDHDIGENDEQINLPYITSLLSKDWGFWRTITLNIEKLKYYANKMKFETHVLDRITRLERAIEESPKGIKWRMRSLVGEKMRWYELPEDRQLSN